jgi:hypothetical protein
MYPIVYTINAIFRVYVISSDISLIYFRHLRSISDRSQQKIINMLFLTSFSQNLLQTITMDRTLIDNRNSITGSNHDEFICSRLCSPHLARPTQNLTYISLRAWQGKHFKAFLKRVKAHQGICRKIAHPDHILIIDIDSIW